MKYAAFFLLLLGATQAGASAAPSLALVPLDDRPVTRQLPIMLGAIAGVGVLTPPRRLLGNYLTPGDPDAIARWLRSGATRDADAFVLSTDMLAYGGLVASRIPGVSESLATSRLRDAVAVRALRPGAAFYGFGTIMRLAPTGIPALGAAARHFAAGDPVDQITTYANLPDPPQTPEDVARAQQLRARLGPLLDQYLATRKRNLEVDRFALQLTAEGGFDRFILGQDDAGPQGLHLRDLAALRAERDARGIGFVTSIEPGADELAMLLEAAALARRSAWVPRVRVTWSRPDGGTLNDPLEYAPLENTAESIIRACGARRVDADPEVELFIRVTGTTPGQTNAFVDAIKASVARGTLTTVADLTFLADNNADEQRSLVERLIDEKIAGKLAGFGFWNTAANSIGTALPAAIAAGTGLRTGGFSRRALAEFLLNRYADDYAFHLFVRPALIAALQAQGTDHSYILPDEAKRVAGENRSQLWRQTLHLLETIFPEYRDAGITITLPWDRTFETEIDVRLRG